MYYIYCSIKQCGVWGCISSCVRFCMLNIKDHEGGKEKKGKLWWTVVKSDGVRLVQELSWDVLIGKTKDVQRQLVRPMHYPIVPPVNSTYTCVVGLFVVILLLSWQRKWSYVSLYLRYSALFDTRDYHTSLGYILYTNVYVSLITERSSLTQEIIIPH